MILKGVYLCLVLVMADWDVPDHSQYGTRDLAKITQGRRRRPI